MNESLGSLRDKSISKYQSQFLLEQYSAASYCGGMVQRSTNKYSAFHYVTGKGEIIFDNFSRKSRVKWGILEEECSEYKSHMIKAQFECYIGGYIFFF